MFSPVLPQLMHSTSLSNTYQFSSRSFESVLEDYHGSTETSLKVLVLSCGDLPFPLQSCYLSSPVKIESITLADDSPIVMARNVLFAKIITNSHFDVSNSEDIEYLWDIWYNMEWPAKTLQRFLQDLKDLAEDNISPNLKIPSTVDKDHLKTIWGFWISSASEMNPTSMKILHEQRYQSIIGHIHGVLYPNQPQKANDSIKPPLSQVWEWMNAHTTDADWSHLPEHHHKAISHEMRTYFETGNCFQINQDIASINPTFLDPISGQWAVSPFVHPFEEYLHLKEFPIEKDFLSSCKKALENQIRSCREWLQEATLSFHLGDSLDLCYRGTWAKSFDIVDCTSLPDKLGLANILNAAKLPLVDDNQAIILTRSSPWQENSSVIRYESTKDFVEESLCAPIEMIPSLYGVTLVNPVRLGTAQPLKGKFRNSIRLVWRNSYGYKNICVNLSGAIEQYFEDLQSRCFGTCETLNAELSETFSPLAYCFLTSSFLSRVELSETHRLAIAQPALSPNLQLAWNTLQAWMDGSEVLQVKIQFTNLTISNDDGRLLRLVLNVNDSGIHFIQNFTFQRESCSNFSVAFMLLKEHPLDIENTVAYLESTATSNRVTSFSSMKDWSFSISDFPMPFKAKEVSDTSLLTCQEFSEFYVVDLPGIKQEEIVLSNDRQPPSEAGYQITLETGSVSQTFHFPWPLKMFEVHSSSDEETGAVRLILPKSIHEPHPFEWNNRKKLNVNQLAAWNEKTLPTDLNYHLSAQFNFRDLKQQILNEEETQTSESDLKGVREIIRTLFQSTVVDGNLLYVIRSKHDPKLTNLWFLRVHLPALVSPHGSPMLLLTANDHRLAQKLVDRGGLKQETATEDFKRIFVEGVPSTQVCPLFVQSDGEENLLRYLLRFNSTKIETNDWPIDQVPTGENSPWLLTFISPSYVDQAGTDADMENLVTITNKTAIQIEENGTGVKLEINSRCSKCKQIKDNLKRCSRCKSAKYCSVDCQRSDWSVHKSACLQ